jgi:hypothetical protein
MQEFRTARNAVLSVHPEAVVVRKTRDAYPLEVKVYSPDREVIFCSPQAALYIKNPERREKSIALIKHAVSTYLLI